MTRRVHPPLKRHPSLQPFSRDHYVGLVQAEHLIRAARGDAVERRGAVAAFLDAWGLEIAEHFDDEERLLDGLMSDAEALRLLDEHEQCRTLAAHARSRRGMVDPGSEWCRELGEALRDHIRWEERELFPAVQARAAPEALAELEAHTREIEASRPRSRGRQG